TPLGISFFDGEKSVLLGQIKPSRGVLIASNVVIYPDCFLDCKGSVRVVLTLAGLEVDVLFHEQLPAPPRAYGLNEALTKTEVLTELFQAPVPVKTGHFIPPRWDASGQPLGEPLKDEKLQFGAMTMQLGRAFSADSAPISQNVLDDSVPVGKSVEV